MTPLTAVNAVTSPERPRFLSEADCRDLVRRVTRFTTGGGHTTVKIMSTWVGNVRWARNQISTSGEVRNNRITVSRNVNGASAEVEINDTTDAVLVAAVRQAERMARTQPEQPNSDLLAREPLEPAATPQLFSEATYQLGTDRREKAAVASARTAADAGVLSAGYIEVAAVGMGVFDTFGRARYFPYTQAQYSVTVRDPKGNGSGWAGIDHYDWAKIDVPQLSQRALETCLKSRNPVAIEPGRYMTILEPQAVCDFVGPMLFNNANGSDFAIQRRANEDPTFPGPFFKRDGTSEERQDDLLGFAMLGERVVDNRLTIGADPMDPELGFPPFWADMVAPFSKDPFAFSVYHPATWIERGVLVNLSYERGTASRWLGRSVGLPNSGAFRMSGGNTSLDEMITTTKRGLLVTRLDRVKLLDRKSQLYRGYTRDGLWLIENGKISKPVKNLVFTESILFALNNIEQIGPPQRTFRPCVAPEDMIPEPAMVPALKIRDFSFTALLDAV